GHPCRIKIVRLLRIEARDVAEREPQHLVGIRRGERRQCGRQRHGAKRARGGAGPATTCHCRSCDGGESLRVSTISSGSLATATRLGRARRGRGAGASSASGGLAACRVSISSRPESGGSASVTGSKR